MSSKDEVSRNLREARRNSYLNKSNTLHDHDVQSIQNNDIDNYQNHGQTDNDKEEKLSYLKKKSTLTKEKTSMSKVDDGISYF